MQSKLSKNSTSCGAPQLEMRSGAQRMRSGTLAPCSQNFLRTALPAEHHSMKCAAAHNECGAAERHTRSMPSKLFKHSTSCGAPLHEMRSGAQRMRSGTLAPLHQNFLRTALPAEHRNLKCVAVHSECGAAQLLHAIKTFYAALLHEMPAAHNECGAAHSLHSIKTF